MGISKNLMIDVFPIVEGEGLDDYLIGLQAEEIIIKQGFESAVPF